MTTDPSYPIPKRGFTGLDWTVLVAAVAAIAAPFAARYLEAAPVTGTRLAVFQEPASVSSIERPGASAFPVRTAINIPEEPSLADVSGDVLDVALAAPASDQPVTVPVQYSIPARFTPIVLSAAPVVASPPDEPDASIVYVALPVSGSDRDDPAFIDDLAVIALAAAPESVPHELIIIEDEPIKVEPEAPLVRVMMTAPPTITPMPYTRPRRAEAEEITVASVGGLEGLRDGERNLQLPIDVTPALPSVPTMSIIDEAPLAPLTPSAPRVDTVVAMAAPRPAETVAAPVAPVASDAVKKDGPKITNGPRIALVIVAAGLNENVTRFAIEALPAGVTLAFAPVKAEARVLAQEAKEDGHTVLVEIPMEPINKNRDPGPLTLRVADPVAQNLDRLNRALAQIPMADGASSYLGARFNAVEGAASPVIKALAKRDMFFFENDPTARSVFRRLAKQANLPYAQGVAKIDRQRDVTSIRAALDALEKQARAQGSAVGVGTTLRGTISTVAAWAKEAEKRGVRFVPVTELGR